MRRRAYWVVATLLLAAVVHLSYVLFSPRTAMTTMMEEARRLTAGPSLKVLSREEGLSFAGPDGDWLVHAVCVFDLTDGPLSISAVIPPAYWSMSIVSATGDNFYSFNDRQADVEQLSILLKQAEVSPLQDTLTETASPEGDTLDVIAPEATGLIVMRALAGEPAEYQRIAKLLAGSSCTPAKR